MTGGKTPSESRDDHYGATLEFFERSARERHGWYDAPVPGRVGQSRWQRRIRRLLFSMLRERKVPERGVDGILEVGCGRGDLLLEAGQVVGTRRLFGIDYSLGTLRLARAHASPVQAVQGDLRRLPFRSQSVDMALCINVLHHVLPVHLPAALGELARVARRHVCLEIKNKENVYYGRYRRPDKDGIVVYPAVTREVSQALKAHGFDLKAKRGVFGPAVLSPLMVLCYERD